MALTYEERIKEAEETLEKDIIAAVERFEMHAGRTAVKVTYDEDKYPRVHILHRH